MLGNGRMFGLGFGSSRYFGFLGQGDFLHFGHI